jgi:hypothetical protein
MSDTKDTKDLNLIPVNKCPAGYCSKHLHPREIAHCVGQLSEDWNERCPHDCGHAVYRSDFRNKIDPGCRSCSHPEGRCKMTPYDFINWNGRCAYEK